MTDMRAHASTHRRAVIVSCLLALVASLTCVTANEITSCGILSNLRYSDIILTFDALETDSEGKRSCTFINSTVDEGGLTIAGTDFVSSGPWPKPDVRLQMLYTTVKDATISIKGMISPNTRMYFTNTKADMRSGRSVFDLNHMKLLENATLTIANTTATWASDVRAGSVVQLSILTPPMAAESGIFIIDAIATRAASVVKTSNLNGASYTIGERAVLAIDHSACNVCSDALASFVPPVQLKPGAMLRITHSNATTYPVLRLWSVDFSADSLLLLSDDTVIDNDVMTFESMYEPRDDKAYLVMHNLAGVRIMNYILPPFHNLKVVLGGWIMDGEPLETIHYASRFIAYEEIDVDGRIGDKCAYAHCMQKNINTSFAYSDCTCPCNTGTHAPFCTYTDDPLAAILAERNSNCHVRNCKTCVTDKSLLCSACDDGYTLRADGTCAQAST